MILRIEDTDVERNRPELVEGILDGLRWLGVDWDEGPYFQSQRLDLHRAAAEKLVASGAAYYCYCPPEKYAGGDAVEETEDAKKEAGAAPHHTLRVPRRQAGIARPESRRSAFAFRWARPRNLTMPCSVRAKWPMRRSRISFCCVLPRKARRTARPTYQLSVVVDDIDMRITHVIRGSDHISNTPKQALLYRALGAAPPIFAHVPLILGPDRTRLSKRHGATSVGSYRDEGFLPEAFRNFLALLGWSPGEDAQFLRTR